MFDLKRHKVATKKKILNLDIPIMYGLVETAQFLKIRSVSLQILPQYLCVHHIEASLTSSGCDPVYFSPTRRAAAT